MKLSLQLCGFVLASAALLHAQSPAPELPAITETIPRMVDPAIDVPGQPFSYASRSTDQLSVPYSSSGAELTPEGYLYTGFGELMFFVGADRQPVNQRIRTLQDGYLPIFHYTVLHQGLEYRFTLFAASLDESKMGQDVVNFVRVTVVNPSSTPRRGFFTTAWRYQAPQTTTFPSGDDRFLRPLAAHQVGDKQQPGEAFNPTSVYSLRNNAFLRDGKVLYFFPEQPQPQLTASYRDYYNRTAPIDAPVSVLPTTPMATAEYAFDLPANGRQVLDFKVPLIPPQSDAASLPALRSAGFQAHEDHLIQFWNAIFARGLAIQTPEAKVNDTFRTSFVNDLSSLNKIDGDYVQTINQLQYHGFYLRDSADFVRMYDTSGYPDIGRKVVDFFASKQQPDGNFLSQPGQYDGWGEALWTYGEHYRITHDREFAVSVYPRILLAVNWLQSALANDPLHIMPATFVRDNEYVAGHLTGYNFLALDGLQAAETIAHDLGKSQDEFRFKALEQHLRSSFMQQLDLVTARTGGYIPPALDGDMAGTDWGNLLSLTPEPQLAPFDPRVTATLQETQSHYQEGLITYRQPDQGTYLHHYLTIKNTLTELIRGEQQQAIREFYAELLHTSSTNAGWEYSIRPWGDRDFSGNLAPHGWFAAEFRNLLRSMMVREDGRQLHLLSAVSPAWIGAGKSIRVQHAQTYFGEIGFALQMPTGHQATLTLDPHFVAGSAPQSILLHIPWFERLSSVRVDGHVQKITRADVIELSPSARTLTLVWSPLPLPHNVPSSYTDAVQRYEREYRARYEQLNRGETQPEPTRPSR